MVYIKVEDSNTLSTKRQRALRSQRYTVENAKSHTNGRFCMMSGWSNSAERIFIFVGKNSLYRPHAGPCG